MRSVRLLLVALLVALGPSAALSADSLQAGPLLHEFDLTLTPGHRTEALGPLFYDQRAQAQHTWAIPPLFSHTTDPDVPLKEVDFLYPILTYDRYGDQYRWQFLQILSFSGGSFPDEGVRHRFTLFPLYFQQRSPDPTKNYTAVVPFYGHLKYHFFRNEIFFVMFPFYSQTKRKEVVTDNYVYPFFHLRHGPGLDGWQLWPFGGHEHKEVTTITNGFNDVQTVAGHDRVFALWPIYFSDYTGLGTTNMDWQMAVLPFYSLERSPLRDSTTVLWPFFSRVDDRGKQYREWDAPWPLIEFARGEGKHTTRIFPFYSRARTPTLEDDYYLWPIFKYNRAQLDPLDRERSRILFYLYSDTTDKNIQTGESKRSTYLWPFFTHRRDFNGNTRLQLLAVLEPFVPGSHKIERDWSPLWALWRSEKNAKTGASSQSLLWNLYRREKAPDRKKVSCLFGLFQYQSDAKTKRVKLFYIPFKAGG
jgi:hypothetical protein